MNINEAIEYLDTHFKMFSKSKTGYRINPHNFTVETANKLYLELDNLKEISAIHPNIKDLMYCYNNNTDESPYYKKNLPRSNDMDIQNTLEKLLANKVVYFQPFKGGINLRTIGGCESRDVNKLYNELSTVLDRFPELSDFTYCFNRGLTDIPRCPYCGDRCQVRMGNEYTKTCGKPECVDKQHKETFENIYGEGVINYSQTQEFRDRMSYVAEHRTQEEKDLINQKCMNTLIERYGDVGYPAKRAMESYKLKTGYRTSLENPEVKQRAMNTYKQRTGYDNPSQNPEVKLKKENTSLANWGCRFPSQNPEVIKKARASYIFDGIYMDSSYEIAVYNHYKKLGIILERCPKVDLKYTDEEGKEHHYIPDFRHPDGHLIECKYEYYFRGEDYEEMVRANAELISDENGKIYPYLAEARSDFGGSATWYRQFKVYKDTTKS